MELRSVPEKETQILALATYSLLFNSCIGPGNLRGHIAQFPSRGGYPTHYLWDSCFHNLALEYMEPRLAEDALLPLLRNLRADGKMAHFLCSTRMRPRASQSPLVGWAAKRLVERRQDLKFARGALPLLVRNTDWWLTQRMTAAGLLYTSDPYESWDNAPRLDQGSILSLDIKGLLTL